MPDQTQDSKQPSLGIIRTSSIGDVILATTCLNFIKRSELKVSVTWIGKAPSIELVRDSSMDIKTIPLENKTSIKNLLFDLKNIDVMIDLQCNLRSRIICHSFKKKFGGKVYSIGKNQVSRGKLLLEGRIYGRTRPMSNNRLATKKHQYEAMNETLALALADLKLIDQNSGLSLTKSSHPFIQINNQYSATKDTFKLPQGPILAIAPGAKHQTKQAPLELFKKILDEVLEEFTTHHQKKENPITLIFLGDSNDRDRAQKLMKELEAQAQCLDFTGSTNIYETAELLSKSNALLSNDSSLAHLSEAVNTPTAVLFGPTIEGFGFAPRMTESKSFSANLGCRPCSKHGKQTCRYQDQLCFRKIEVDPIGDHLIGLLRGE